MHSTPLHLVVVGRKVRDAGQEAGAPGGIRTPDLLIRSPMPAGAASLPRFVLNRAAGAARIGVRSQRV
jgi:hypothetical protein